MGRSLISNSILNELFPVLTFVVWGLFLPGKFLLEHEVICVCSSPLPVNQGEPVKGWVGSPSPCSTLLPERRYWPTHTLVHLAVYFTHSHSARFGKQTTHPASRNPCIHLKGRGRFISITLERCFWSQHSVKTNYIHNDIYFFKNRYWVL